MPKRVAEITEGVGFSRSGEEGQVADEQPRVFRVILNSPTELINIEETCGVRIGDELRPGAKIYCTSFDARYENNSRLVLLCTFRFRTTAGSDPAADPKQQAPDVRPPNWTTSTSLIESPLYTWRKRNDVVPEPLVFPPPPQVPAWDAEAEAANPAGDIYDGVTRLVPMVTISATIFVTSDPTVDNEHAGKLNNKEHTLGSLKMPPHTMMFRGVQLQPAVESWGGLIYRGWNATYEFAYKKNETKIRLGEADQVVALGWDIAVPQSGFNVKTFVPPGDAAVDDPYGQPLKFDDDGAVTDPVALPDDLAADQKARAMIRVPLKDKSSQAPSASPIPLNDNGRPRLDTAVPKVLVYGYAVQPDMDFAQLAGGRNLFQ